VRVVTRARVAIAAAVAGVANVVLGAGIAHGIGVEKLEEALRSHGLRVIGEPSDIVPHVVVRILTGALVALLFAGLAPRFGAGPRGAVVTALFAWALLYAHTAWGYAHIGLFDASLAWTFAIAGLVEIVATAFLAGWVARGNGFWRG
jgi:hypothetical protein